jgi:hypothetical protein
MQTTASAQPHPLTLQMLAWLADPQRTYREAMDAWRTSCPRFSVWEDALADHLIAVGRPISGSRMGDSLVEVTPEGRAMLDHFGASRPAVRR